MYMLHASSHHTIHAHAAGRHGRIQWEENRLEPELGNMLFTIFVRAQQAILSAATLTYYTQRSQRWCICYACIACVCCVCCVLCVCKCSLSSTSIYIFACILISYSKVCSHHHHHITNAHRVSASIHRNHIIKGNEMLAGSIHQRSIHTHTIVIVNVTMFIYRSIITHDDCVQCCTDTTQCTNDVKKIWRK